MLSQSSNTGRRYANADSTCFSGCGSGGSSCQFWQSEPAGGDHLGQVKFILGPEFGRGRQESLAFGIELDRAQLAGPVPATTKVNRSMGRTSRRSVQRAQGRGRSGRDRACRELLAGSAGAARHRPAAKGPPGGGTPRARPARGSGRSDLSARGKWPPRACGAHGLGNSRVNAQEYPRRVSRLEDLAEFIDRSGICVRSRQRAALARAGRRSPARARFPGFGARMKAPPPRTRSIR